jgi:hypothetical protein
MIALGWLTRLVAAVAVLGGTTWANRHLNSFERGLRLSDADQALYDQCLQAVSWLYTRAPELYKTQGEIQAFAADQTQNCNSETDTVTLRREICVIDCQDAPGGAVDTFMAACQRVGGLVGVLRVQARSFFDLRNMPICLASPDAEPTCDVQVMVRYYEDFYGDFYSDRGCVCRDYKRYCI